MNIKSLNHINPLNIFVHHLYNNLYEVVLNYAIYAIYATMKTDFDPEETICNLEGVS